MDNPSVTNPRDYEVVTFFNNTNFDFTPELGAMFNGVGMQINSGEKKQFPYHIGHRLAVNLAKALLIKGAPLHDPSANNPVGTPLWGDEKVRALEASFIIESYTETKPIAQTETERLIAKVAELEKLFQAKEAQKPLDAPRPEVKSVEELVTKGNTPTESITPVEAPKVYQDKAEVIAELEARGIKFDRRQSMDNLIKLLK